jgi:hypothetical protein
MATSRWERKVFCAALICLVGVACMAAVARAKPVDGVVETKPVATAQCALAVLLRSGGQIEAPGLPGWMHADFGLLPTGTLFVVITERFDAAMDAPQDLPALISGVVTIANTTESAAVAVGNGTFWFEGDHLKAEAPNHSSWEFLYVTAGQATRCS